MPIRVLIVDDSALIRELFTEMLAGDPAIEVAGTASDPYEARDMIKRLNPDVMTLDIEMPKMDGLDFLEKVMRLRPMPVIMVSSLTQKGADASLRALELGAVDCLAKSASDRVDHLESMREELVAKVKAAAQARITPRPAAVVPSVLAFDAGRAKRNLIAIGASTGGVEALRAILTRLPANTPPIVIVQHMPEHYTRSFANRMNALCALEVSEAVQGEALRPGHAYIAPGGKHMEIRAHNTQFSIHLHQGPLVCGHRPSVDVLFYSVAGAAGNKAVGLILTGMGNDGAQGLRRMRDQGAYTLGQDESSCVVYGMPKTACAAGAVMEEFSLHHLPSRLLNVCMM